MNEKQKRLIVVGVVAVILLGLFPPWLSRGGEPVGHGFIFATPDILQKSIGTVSVSGPASANGWSADKEERYQLWLNGGGQYAAQQLIRSRVNAIRLSFMWIMALLVTGTGVLLTVKKENKE